MSTKVAMGAEFLFPRLTLPKATWRATLIATMFFLVRRSLIGGPAAGLVCQHGQFSGWPFNGPLALGWLGTRFPARMAPKGKPRAFYGMLSPLGGCDLAGGMLARCWQTTFCHFGFLPCFFG